MITKKLLYYIFLFLLITSLCANITHASEIKINNFSDISINTINNPDSLIIIERDYLLTTTKPNSTPNINTTANLTLIIAHEADIMNNANVSKTITIYNTIPKEKYLNIYPYPKFGKNATLQESLIPKIYPNNTLILAEPTIEIGQEYVNYTWYNITISPGDMVVAAYANYFEDGSNIYNISNISSPDAITERSYHANYQTYGASLEMNYTLKNIGALKLHNPELTLFFPEKINETNFVLMPDKIFANPSSNAIISGDGYNHHIDGTGYFSMGHLVTSRYPEYLDANEELNFNVKIEGTIKNAGKIFPEFFIYYAADTDLYNETGKMTRIWPASEIVSSERINLTRSYYYKVWMDIPENNYFAITLAGDDPLINSSSSTPIVEVPISPTEVQTPAISALSTLLLICIMMCYLMNKKLRE